MALPPGTRLGVYDVTAQIGEGGMGQVYRATDTKLKRQVAIKILPPSLAADRDRIARFQREAEVLASLNHPNIAGIYGIEESGGTTALVMELVEGEDLSQRIARGPLPLDEALLISTQIVEALEAAHEQGIIHRDLKPANIKVRRDGTVKVLDFGLAKAMEPTGAMSSSNSMSPTITTPAMTMAGVILGTAAYMSPEQARGKPVDKRADVWAFGAVLYEMLTGKRAFPGEDVTDTLAAVVKLDPKWDAVGAAVPSRVLQALRACLQKDPQQRVRDIHDVRLALEGAFEVAASQTAAPATPTGRLMWRAALAVAVVVIVAMAVPTVRHLRESTPDMLPIRFEIQTPSTDDPLSFAISPDGRQIAFVATREGDVSRLWIRALDQMSAQPLAGTEDATYPFWAPDNRALGFFADKRLKRIDIAGGAPQVLADAANGRGGTWNRDDVILFAGHTESGLARVAATGGPPTPVAHVEFGRRAFARWPQFLPDGRRFLFYAYSPDSDTRGVYLGSLDGGDSTRIIAADTAATYAPPGYLLAVQQERLVAWSFDLGRGSVSGDPVPLAAAVGSDNAVARGAFSVSSAGVLAHRTGTGGQQRRWVWVDRSGRVLSTLGAADTAAPSSPELAPDGRRVALVRVVQANTDVWLMDVARGVQSRFTANPAVDVTPLWSPDGRRVVFKSTRKPGAGLFEKPADGVGDEQSLFVPTATEAWPLSWSPDGRLLLYLYGRPAALWVLPMTGDRKPFPVVQTNFAVTEGQFSPDGHWVAYASDASGRREVSVRPFPGPGETSQVSTAGGSQIRWRRDGHELYYLAPDATLMAVPIAPGKDRETLEVGAAVPLFRARLARGANVLDMKPQYAVAPDGRFLMNVRSDEDTAPPIKVVLNWQAGLKK